MSKRQAFHNTISAEGQLLMNFEEQNTRKNPAVLRIFEEQPDREFTPIEVHDILIKRKHYMLLTSARRAISDLTRDKELIMHPKEKQKDEIYGKPNNTWQYNKNKFRENGSDKGLGVGERAAC